MNQLSPETVKSSDTFQLSESDYQKTNLINMQAQSHNSSKENIESCKTINTMNNKNKLLNSDLAEECDYDENNYDGQKASNPSGTIRFISTEIISGSAERGIHHESHASDAWSSQELDSMNYEDQAEPNIEDSVENSAFIRNMMERRNLSPQNLDRDDSLQNPQIYVGSLSDESDDRFTDHSNRREENYISALSPFVGEEEKDENISMTDPDHQLSDEHPFGDPIRVENDFREELNDHDLQELEEEKESGNSAQEYKNSEIELIKYPPINETIPEESDQRTDDVSSLGKHIEEWKSSFSSNKIEESPAKNEDDDKDLNQNSQPQEGNLLAPNKLSPVQTVSRNSIPEDSSGSMMSPPWSSFGMQTENLEDSDINKENVDVFKKSAKFTKSKFQPKSDEEHKQQTGLSVSPLSERDINSDQVKKLSPLTKKNSDKKACRTYVENQWEFINTDVGAKWEQTYKNKLSPEKYLEFSPPKQDASIQVSEISEEELRKEGEKPGEWVEAIREYGLSSSSLREIKMETMEDPTDEIDFKGESIEHSGECQQIIENPNVSAISKGEIRSHSSTSLDEVPVKETDKRNYIPKEETKEISKLSLSKKSSEGERKSLKSKRGSLKNDQNIDLNIIRNTVKAKPKKKAKTDHIIGVVGGKYSEHNLGNQSKYIQKYMTVEHQYDFQNNMIKEMKALSSKLEAFDVSKVKNKSKVKKSKKYKRSPINKQKKLKCIPSAKIFKRSKSKDLQKIEEMNDILKKYRLMVDNAKQRNLVWSNIFYK